MKRIHHHESNRQSCKHAGLILLMVSALSTSTENSFASNIDKQQRKSINRPQLIAQISAEERLKERAKQEVAETTKQVKTCQTNWKLYYRRASALTALVRYEEALEDSAKAIKLDPKQVDPLLLHARLCESTLDDETAAKDYTAAINLGTPLSSNYMLLRSHCYESMLKPDLALTDALGYLKGHPERYDTNTARIIGTLYLKLSKGKEAVEHFTYCLKIKPKMSKVHEMRGDSYMLLKNYKAAAEDYTFEINRMPNIVTKLYEKRANAYRKDGQLQKAAQDETKVKSVSHEVFDIAPFRN